MTNYKAKGPLGIPVEAWKCLGEMGIDRLTELMQKIWNEEEMPREWSDSVITPICKEKGDDNDCNNYRGNKII
jgi:hypothetical protein